MIGGEIAVRDPEIPLQLDGIARSQRDQGLQPDGGSERDMGRGDFAEGAPISVAPFSTSRPRMRAVALALIL